MNHAPIKILLQTTIVPTEDDWSIGRPVCSQPKSATTAGISTM